MGWVRLKSKDIEHKTEIHDRKETANKWGGEKNLDYSKFDREEMDGENLN